LTYQSDEVEKVVLHESKSTSTFRKVLIGLGCCCLGSVGVFLPLYLCGDNKWISYDKGS